MTAKGDTSDEELLKRAFRDVRPLKRRAPPPTPAPKPVVQRPVKKAAKPPPAPPPPPKKSELPELKPGAAVGVDVRTVKKLKRGQMTVDARLDLHGHTQETAYDALARFLGASQAKGARTVLVVTGKSGVLRGLVPRWLNAAPNRARVLSFVSARPADGGEGALYVLLRKAHKP